VAHGVIADEILEACDDVHADDDDHMTNPTISIAQALRRRNLATFRNLAQQHLKKTSDSEGGGHGKSCAPHPSLVHHPQALPMTIQGLQTNLKDPHSHIVYFDIETLIGRYCLLRHREVDNTNGWYCWCSCMFTVKSCFLQFTGSFYLIDLHRKSDY